MLLQCMHFHSAFLYHVLNCDIISWYYCHVFGVSIIHHFKLFSSSILEHRLLISDLNGYYTSASKLLLPLRFNPLVTHSTLHVPFPTWPEFWTRATIDYQSGIKSVQVPDLQNDQTLFSCFERDLEVLSMIGVILRGLSSCDFFFYSYSGASLKIFPQFLGKFKQRRNNMIQ